MNTAKKPRFVPLVFEIGCEEIPARFLDQAQQSLGEQVQSALDQARLLPPTGSAGSAAAVQCFWTPRRLVAYAPEVRRRQADTVEEVLGPPVRVAFDEKGSMTRAAASFARKNAASADELVRVSTPKGEYLAVRKRVRGRSARRLLGKALPDVVANLPFPKSMYWTSKTGPRFARPIRWILAVLGAEADLKVIRFKIGGVASSQLTHGHRAAGKAQVRVRSFTQYVRKLRERKVELDPSRRRARILGGVKVLLEGLRLKIVKDPGTLNWVVNSCEWPTALLGNFDKRYLSLPREVLVQVMRDRQKYFAVEDRKGRLRPCFITVLNARGGPTGVIRAGHERVLAAAFKDAEFFWNADQQVKLSERLELLSQVTYEAGLGSYFDKVERMKSVARELTNGLAAQSRMTQEDVEHAGRAVALAKCDLTTWMVREFPELQGVVGGLYARAQGEPVPVWEAVYDHYLPKGLEDQSPRSLAGAVVSLADKVDSVVAGFAAGHAPSGSSDPFGIRRQGNGIIKVLVEYSLPVNLRQAVAQALGTLNVEWEKPQSEVFSEIMDFLGERLKYYLERVRQLRFDTVRAVMSAGWDAPLDALLRAECLEGMRDSREFEALFTAARRIKNILAKSATASDWMPGDPNPGLFSEAPERDLYQVFIEASGKAEKLRQAGDFRGALGVVAGMRPAVDTFFDKVLVMAEDAAVRENRLRLLGGLDRLFSGIAWFAEMAPGAADVGAPTSGVGD